jgi:hypothetical protein
MAIRRLSDLVQMDSPDAVLNEVLIILHQISPAFNTASIASIFLLTVSLFKGNYPGYRACNTGYHDLQHTTDTFLAMTRLIHGAFLEGKTFTERHIILGLISSLLHDAGYIQREYEIEGTGSRYTANHVQRSIDFLKRDGEKLGLSNEEIANGGTIILYTDLSADISSIRFPSIDVELLSKMLAAADLLAQMADRTYLEKLLFLYHEFREAGVGDYESEVDLLRKTVGFYDLIARRLETMLDSVDRFIIPHLAARWDIHVNLYQEAIENQKTYLRHILDMQDADPRGYLRRSGIVDTVRAKYGGMVSETDGGPGNAVHG